MPKLNKLTAITLILLLLNTASAEQLTAKPLNQQVMATEQAFADSMAQRDFEAFKSFLSDEAVFFSESGALRGKREVFDAWQAYFTDEPAPFSWKPEQVEVLDSGMLAHSSGPVFNVGGEQIATFNSIWRYDRQSQKWLIVFDKGSKFCEPRIP